VGKGEKRRSASSRWAGGVRARREARVGRQHREVGVRKGYLQVELDLGKVDGCPFLAPCPVCSMAYDQWQ
jgi:hypothetical protein